MSGVTRRRASLASQVAGSGSACGWALRGLFILERYLVSNLIAYKGAPPYACKKAGFLTEIRVFRGVQRRRRPDRATGLRSGKFFSNLGYKLLQLDGYCKGTGAETGAGATAFSFVPTATGASLLTPPVLSSGIFTVRTVPLPRGKSASALRIR